MRRRSRRSTPSASAAGRSASDSDGTPRGMRTAPASRLKSTTVWPTTPSMRAVSFTALIAGVCLIPSALGLAKLDHDHRLLELDRALVAETDEHGGALDNYFARARSVVLLTANSPAFAHVLAGPGTRTDKVRRHSRNIAEVTHHLRYLEHLYPTSIGEACFIDADGEELARVVRGDV